MKVRYEIRYPGYSDVRTADLGEALRWFRHDLETAYMVRFGPSAECGCECRCEADCERLCALCDMIGETDSALRAAGLVGPQDEFPEFAPERLPLAFAHNGLMIQLSAL